MSTRRNIYMLVCLMLAITCHLSADDGSELWLRNSREAGQPEASVTVNVIPEAPLTVNDHATLMLAVQELRDHWMGAPVMLSYLTNDDMGEGAFRLEKTEAADPEFTVTASSASGLLYGVYFMLRAQSRHDGCLCTTLPPSHVIEQRPHFSRRWMSGQDVALDLLKKGRIGEYARANASIGINGIVLSRPRHPSRQFEERVRQLAELLRPYCITVCLSADSLSSFVSITDTESTSKTHAAGLFVYHAAAWRRSMLESKRPDVLADVTVSSQPSWCDDDNHLEQANWFAFGRLAWDPTFLPVQVAHEWLADTFSENPLFILPLREALVACDGKNTRSVETLLDTWRESALSVDDQRHTEVEHALNAQLEQIEE